ncbi:hypothetical protein A4X13_0g1571 [Tilletia indica]|uniref:Uncharacterized protein n=1 Tax=Tilletia indica TaxID=43049 RepID=A0A177TK42_9BASI|nr:hypothetical protein A4X13_0g1571 [Tilletia indica]
MDRPMEQTAPLPSEPSTSPAADSAMSEQPPVVAAPQARDEEEDAPTVQKDDPDDAERNEASLLSQFHSNTDGASALSGIELPTHYQSPSQSNSRSPASSAKSGSYAVVPPIALTSTILLPDLSRRGGHGKRIGSVYRGGLAGSRSMRAAHQPVSENNGAPAIRSDAEQSPVPGPSTSAPTPDQSASLSQPLPPDSPTAATLSAVAQSLNPTPKVAKKSVNAAKTRAPRKSASNAQSVAESSAAAARRVMPARLRRVGNLLEGSSLGSELAGLIGDERIEASGEHSVSLPPNTRILCTTEHENYRARAWEDTEAASSYKSYFDNEEVQRACRERAEIETPEFDPWDEVTFQGRKRFFEPTVDLSIGAYRALQRTAILREKRQRKLERDKVIKDRNRVAERIEMLKTCESKQFFPIVRARAAVRPNPASASSSTQPGTAAVAAAATALAGPLIHTDSSEQTTTIASISKAGTTSSSTTESAPVLPQDSAGTTRSTSGGLSGTHQKLAQQHPALIAASLSAAAAGTRLSATMSDEAQMMHVAAESLRDELIAEATKTLEKYDVAIAQAAIGLESVLGERDDVGEGSFAASGSGGKGAKTGLSAGGKSAGAKQPHHTTTGVRRARYAESSTENSDVESNYTTQSRAATPVAKRPRRSEVVTSRASRASRRSASYGGKVDHNMDSDATAESVQRDVVPSKSFDTSATFFRKLKKGKAFNEASDDESLYDESTAEGRRSTRRKGTTAAQNSVVGKLRATVSASARRAGIRQDRENLVRPLDIPFRTFDDILADSEPEEEPEKRLPQPSVPSSADSPSRTRIIPPASQTGNLSQPPLEGSSNQELSTTVASLNGVVSSQPPNDVDISALAMTTIPTAADSLIEEGQSVVPMAVDTVEASRDAAPPAVLPSADATPSTVVAADTSAEPSAQRIARPKYRPGSLIDVDVPPRPSFHTLLLWGCYPFTSRSLGPNATEEAIRRNRGQWSEEEWNLREFGDPEGGERSASEIRRMLIFGWTTEDRRRPKSPSVEAGEPSSSDQNSTVPLATSAAQSSVEQILTEPNSTEQISTEHSSKEPNLNGHFSADQGPGESSTNSVQVERPAPETVHAPGSASDSSHPAETIPTLPQDTSAAMVGVESAENVAAQPSVVPPSEPLDASAAVVGVQPAENAENVSAQPSVIPPSEPQDASAPDVATQSSDGAAQVAAQLSVAPSAQPQDGTATPVAHESTEATEERAGPSEVPKPKVQQTSAPNVAQPASKREEKKAAQPSAAPPSKYETVEETHLHKVTASPFELSETHMAHSQLMAEWEDQVRSLPAGTKLPPKPEWDDVLRDVCSQIKLSKGVKGKGKGKGKEPAVNLSGLGTKRKTQIQMRFGTRSSSTRLQTLLAFGEKLPLKELEKERPFDYLAEYKYRKWGYLTTVDAGDTTTSTTSAKGCYVTPTNHGSDSGSGRWRALMEVARNRDQKWLKECKDFDESKLSALRKEFDENKIAALRKAQSTSNTPTTTTDTTTSLDAQVAPLQPTTASAEDSTMSAPAVTADDESVAKEVPPLGPSEMDVDT